MCQFLTSELQRSEPGVSCTFWLASVLVATAACHFATSELPKVVRTVLDILTCKCASRYSGAQFFDIWTSQKPVSFLAFWLANVLLATAACHFPTSDLQKVVRTHQFFSILTWTWKCASQQFKAACEFSCLSETAIYLRTRRFSEPTFRPSGTTNHAKNKTFLTFRARGSFFLLTLLSSDSTFFWVYVLLTLLLCSVFHLSIFSEVRLLNFLWLVLSSNSSVKKYFSEV